MTVARHNKRDVVAELGGAVASTSEEFRQRDRITVSNVLKQHLHSISLASCVTTTSKTGIGFASQSNRVSAAPLSGLGIRLTAI